MVFETERVVLRAWDAVGDLEDAIRIYSDPEVVRYIGGETRLITAPEQMTARLTSQMVQRGDGLGRWAIERREDRRVIGNGILDHIQQGYAEPFEEIEIGWHLARDVWGRGYASEAAAVLLRHGFETLGLDEIFAVVSKGNEASARVATRLGLKRIGDTDRYYGELLDVFRMRRSEY